MLKYVTVFGKDPQEIAEPEPLTVPPTFIRIVDKKGNAVVEVDTATDHAEVVSNMTARNLDLDMKARAVEVPEGETKPEAIVHPIPTADQSYQSLLYRAKMDCEIHNGQHPDDPWVVQVQQDDPEVKTVDIAAPETKE